MPKPKIDPETCVGCGVCVDECEPKALELVDNVAKLTKPDICNECGHCAEVCPVEAIKME